MASKTKLWLLETFGWFAVLFFGFFLFNYGALLLPFLYGLKANPPYAAPENFTVEMAASPSVMVTLSDRDLYLISGHTPEEFAANREYLFRIAEASFRANIEREIVRAWTYSSIFAAVVALYLRLIWRWRKKRLI